MRHSSQRWCRGTVSGVEIFGVTCCLTSGDRGPSKAIPEQSCKEKERMVRDCRLKLCETTLSSKYSLPITRGLPQGRRLAMRRSTLLPDTLHHETPRFPIALRWLLALPHKVPSLLKVSNCQISLRNTGARPRSTCASCLYSPSKRKANKVSNELF